MLHADGYDEETIVVGLLHDVGFLACPDRHGAFAAELLGGYVSDENYWMLRHHQAFATFVPQPMTTSRTGSSHGIAGGTIRRGLDDTFVRHYDQNAIDPSYGNRPWSSSSQWSGGFSAAAPKPLRLDS